MNTVKLRLTNNSTIDLAVSDDDLDAALTQLGEVMTNPLSLYTTEMHGGTVTVPGRNILFLEVSEVEEEATEEEEAEESPKYTVTICEIPSFEAANAIRLAAEKATATSEPQVR
ncbi:hypothetical protein DEIPH_ctg011orf0027 [Deinococcus phoenicis]|uniref:Uncharacterized protein n=1 Tax=Deinococcus phoenicis TaxID=1476583 RepID=A0A016QSW5_9DEIO|nr:hypothetical protein [Deinococcus phoenicis]EYB69061.1 hypothetical protein DEIPH_ctg011orf0027 [Deinococcus phoenicis]